MSNKANIKSNFPARNIALFRKLRGKSQGEMASGLGISKQALSKLEQSETISKERFYQIARLMEVSAEALQNFDENDFPFDLDDDFTYSNKRTAERSEQLDAIIVCPIAKISQFYAGLLEKEQEKSAILSNRIR